RRRGLLVNGEGGPGQWGWRRGLRDGAAAPRWLECRCIEETQASPLQPIVELLQHLDEPLDATLSRYGIDLAENVPLLRELLALPPDERFPRPLISRELQKERTLAVILLLLVRMAEAHPVVFAVEDLHWADPTTLELLAPRVRELRGAQPLEPESAPRLLALFTARPGFTPMWAVTDVSSLQLSRLSADDVAVMVHALLGPQVTDQVMRAVMHNAEGVPLFIEEVTHAFLDTGPPADHPSDRSIRLSGSLRGLFMSRLDRLSPDGRETAQLAATLGR